MNIDPTIMKFILLCLALSVFVTEGSIRVRRGFGGGGSYGGIGGGHGGGSGGGGYGGGGGAGTHVLIAGSGYHSSGSPAHVLNAGSGPIFWPYGGQQEQWYHNAAIHSGDIYAAKAIAQGSFDIDQANAAAASGAAGVYASANDPAIAAAAIYSGQHAQQASLNAAAYNGATYGSYH